MVLSNYRDTPQLLPSFLNGKELKGVTSMKILCLTLSSSLKWDDEFTHKLIKAKKLSYALRHLSYSFSARYIKLLFDAVFIPTLFY